MKGSPVPRDDVITALLAVELGMPTTDDQRAVALDATKVETLIVAWVGLEVVDPLGAIQFELARQRYTQIGRPDLARAILRAQGLLDDGSE